MSTMLEVSYTLPNWPIHPPGPDRFEPEAGDIFNVLVIGAGAINFGSAEGPWNHSMRLEHKLGPRLKIVAIIDPIVDRTNDVLKKKRASFVVSAYQETKAYKTVEEFASDMTAEQKPKLVLVGCPPAYRGSDEPGKDLELKLLELFPGVALFVEKPVAAGTFGEIERCFRVADKIYKSEVLCSVGYMLRHLKAVQTMKQIIQQNNLRVMATIARYACAYEAIRKLDWWDKQQSGGPVLEQATHFCDLSRYFGGDVDLSTLQTNTVQWNEEPGKLSRINIDESKILEENRIPRVTAANWKYKSGAVGVLTHLVALQGQAYSCELEVYCDGYLMKLLDPYGSPALHVRRPGSDVDEVYKFEDDDPFFSELSTFIDIIENGNAANSNILSSFEDACKTYELTWAIRKASERGSTY